MPNGVIEAVTFDDNYLLVTIWTGIDTATNRRAILECGSSHLAASERVSLARGWESKSVEEQQSQAATTFERKPSMTSEQIASQQQRQGLMLNRQRILQQLQTACNARHRAMLEAALAELDAQLSRLG